MKTEHTDVLVVGGGTAGFGAAIAAAREGLQVTLLEATSKIGGVMAFCPGMPWGGAYPMDQIIGGIIEELTERLASLEPPAAEKRACTLDNFGPEIIYDHDRRSGRACQAGNHRYRTRIGRHHNCISLML